MARDDSRRVFDATTELDTVLALKHRDVVFREHIGISMLSLASMNFCRVS